MRAIVFTKDAFEQYNEWVLENRKIHERLKKLIDEVVRNPFDGTGKPELLKGDLKGCWSRRIDEQHRLVYKVSDDSVTIISCRNHYFDK